MSFVNLRGSGIFSILSAARCLAVLLLFTTFHPGTLEAQENETRISAQPYPVSDLQITREDLTSRTFLLHIKNLQVVPKVDNRVHSHMLYVAGARGRTPTVEIDSADFSYIQNGEETTATEEVPSQVRQNLSRVADIGLMRQFWVYTLTLTTVSPQGNTNYWALRSATLKVDIGEAPSTGDVDMSRWSARFGEPRLLQSLVVNPNVPAEYYHVANDDPIQAWKNWADQASPVVSSGNMYKFTIFSGGIYKLSPEQLEDAGSVPASSPSRWRVYRNGIEVSLLADPQDPDSAVYLPVESSDTDGLSEMVYWLDTSGSETDGGPARLEPVNSGTTASESMGISAGTIKIQHREFNDYNPKLKPGPGNDRWFWAGVEVDAPASIELEMPEHFAPDPGSTVRATVRYGFTNFPPVQPALLIYASGHDAVGTTLTTQQGTINLDLPAEMLKPGKNPMAMRLSYPNAPGPRRPVVVQDIVTEWQQPLKANTSTYNFVPAGSPTTVPLRLEFSDSISAGIKVLGYSEQGIAVLPVDGSSVVVPPGLGITNFQVVNFNEALDVYGLEQVQEQFGPAQIETAESVIITAPELLDGANAIKLNQERRGLSVALFTTDQINNTFGYGNRSAVAIRSALRYMFYNAAGAPPDYVTLIGEASDFQGDPRLVPPHVQLDMIPSAAVATPETPQGDHQYAAAIGTDQVADFILGRISASNVGQVLDYAAKSTEYESGDAGPWSRITEFVMDDNDEFPDVVRRIAANGMAPTAQTNLLRQWDYEYVPNLRVQGKKRSWTATEELIDKFNEGFGVLNFFGHGGPNLWSHERLLHLSDMPLITNNTQLPLITCASCDNAWITYPMPPVKASMGELMVVKRDGGAIGLFGPVSGASPYEHSTLVQSLMEGITREQIRRTGDAILYAKNRYYGITRSASIPEQYLLLGDPTVSLKMPRVDSNLQVSPDEFRAGKNQSITVSQANSNVAESTGILTLRTSSGNELTSQTIAAGEKQWEIEISNDFEGGALFVQVERYGSNQLNLSGTAIRVMPSLESSITEKISLVKATGNAYVISPVSANVDVAGNASPSYTFSIVSSDGTTESVKILAFVKGEKVGELFRVEPGTGESGKEFEISTSVNLGNETTSILSLKVVPADANDDAPALAAVDFSVPVKTSADLHFVEGSGRAYTESGEFVSNATVFLEGELQNKGHRAAETFTLQALSGDPSTGTELQTINESTGIKIERMEPGERRRVVFRWENASRGEIDSTYLVVNRNKVVQEPDYSNNYVEIPPFEVNAVGNFTVADFNVSPQYATPGTTVTVNGTLKNGFHLNDRPVVVEVGWERSVDKATTSTLFPVTFDDGEATFTKEISTPAGYTHVFAKVNANLEIEELNPGDNTTHTASMIVYDMPEVEGQYPLGESFSWGSSYNFDNPFDGQLQVATEFSSKTGLLIVDHSNVTSGDAVPADVPNDNKWQVALWRVVAGEDEDPGELGLSLPLDTIRHDVPGVLSGYFLPYESPQVPIEVRLRGQSEWTTPKPFGSEGNRTTLQFGSVETNKTALEWEMRKADNAGFTLEYLIFRPEAAQWDSPPYLLPESLRSTPLTLQFEMGDVRNWKSIYVDRRSGKRNESGGITWGQWSSAHNSVDVPVYAEEYLQIRILGIPKPDEHPYIENVRIGRQ